MCVRTSLVFRLIDFEINILGSVGRAPGPSAAAAMDFSGIRLPTSSSNMTPPRAERGQVDPYTLRELLLSSPHEVALLKQNNPPLAEALLSNDPGESWVGVIYIIILVIRVQTKYSARYFNAAKILSRLFDYTNAVVLLTSI